MSALCSLPATLLHRVYGRWQRIWEHSFFSSIAFQLGEEVPIAQSWFILALWVIPYANWNNSYSLIAFVLLTLLFYVGGMRNKALRMNFSAIGWCWPLMLLAIVISVITSMEPSESFRYLFFHISAALCVLITVSAVKKEQDLVRLAAASGGVVLVSSFYGLIQRLEGVEVVAAYVDLTLNEDMPGRVDSFFDNPNTFGQVLILLIPIVLALVFVSRHPLGKLAALVATGFGVMALGMTYSRAGWVGLAVALTVMVFLWKPRYVILFVVIGVAALPLLPDTIWNRILTIFNFSDSSTSSRFPLYIASLEAIGSSPIIGAGLGIPAVQTWIEERGVYQETASFVHAHNTILQVWLEIGLLGVIGFLGAICTQVKGAVHLMKQKTGSTSRTLAYGGAAALVGAMACGMADYLWNYPRVMMIFWFVFAFTAASIKLCLQETPKEQAI